MHLETTFTVDRPIGEVYEAWMDLERSPEWADPVIERRKLTEGPVGVGTTYLARDQFPGRIMEFTVEITQYDPPAMVAAAWDGVMGGGWTARFRETGGTTAVDLEADVTPRGWLKVMSPIISSFARKAMVKDMQAFATWVESGRARRED